MVSWRSHLRHADPIWRQPGRLRRTTIGCCLLLLAAVAPSASEDGPAPDGGCGVASNCGGLGGWRLILLADEPDLEPGAGSGVTTAPDVAVDAPTVDDPTPTVDDRIVLGVRVRNHGDGGAEATSLRWLRSPDATIDDNDLVEGTASVGSLAPGSETRASITLTVPAAAGTYWYGACVDSVPGEVATGDNCSPGTRVVVSAEGGGFGALAVDFYVSTDCPGLAAGIVFGRPTRTAALDDAVTACRNDGGSVAECNDTRVSFTECAALAYGTKPDGCSVGAARGSSLSAAESEALGDCRVDGGTSCRIWVNNSGQRIAGCNTQRSGVAASARADDDRALLLLRREKPGT